MKENKKEITGIYNTTFNEKSATPIKTQFEKDIEAIENAIIEEVVMYVRGFHNFRIDKGMGAEHIKLHLEPNSKGFISINELLNLGNSIREYLKIFKEPFLIKENRKAFEWENQEGIRFRCIVVSQKGGSKLPLSPSDNVIITFYSDRNLNTRMEFKNLKVAKHYKSIEKKQLMVGTPTPHTQAQSLDGRLVQKNISSAEKIIPQNPKPQELKNTLKPQIKPKYKEQEDEIISSKTFKKSR